MKVLVVYESMYGNTAAIARAIGEGFASGDVDVSVVSVDQATEADATGCDMLVVGGPTHAHGMTRTATRTTAIQDTKNSYEEPTTGEGLRGWLDRLPKGGGRLGASFDTRIDAPAAFTGSASKGIAHRLESRGFTVADRASFLVTKGNELVEGERESATAWGATLATSHVAA